MGDDRGQIRVEAERHSRGHRASGSSVLTPPTGIPAVPFDGACPPRSPRGRSYSPPVRSNRRAAAGTRPTFIGTGVAGATAGSAGPDACTAYRPSQGAVGRLLRSLGLRR